MDNVNQCLQELKNKGFNPRIIIDIGANQGDWTKMASNIFKDSKFLMIEGNEKHLNYLSSLKNNKIDYEICLLSNNEDITDFYTLKSFASDGLETGASIFREKSSLYQNDNNIDIKKIKSEILDNLLQQKQIKDVDFIKLDVQGAEINVLEGALETLKNVKFCLLEVHMQRWNDNAPLVIDIMDFMKKNNFILYDICSLAKVDGFLINSDFLFKKDDETFSYKF